MEPIHVQSPLDVIIWQYLSIFFIATLFIAFFSIVINLWKINKKLGIIVDEIKRKKESESEAGNSA